MKPTNEQINRQIAEMLGWIKVDDNAWHNNFGETVPLPNWCQKGTDLSEIWSAVEHAKSKFFGYDTDPVSEFFAFLSQSVSVFGDVRMSIHSAPLKMQITAALIATGYWPTSWLVVPKEFYDTD